MPAHNAGKLLRQRSLYAILAITRLLFNCAELLFICTQLLFACFACLVATVLRVYPGNWFNDFRNIEVSMEEFSENKKGASKPVQPEGSQPGSFLANTRMSSAN